MTSVLGRTEGSFAMRVTLIHNPDSGDDAQPSGNRLLALIRRRGHQVTYVSSQENWRSRLETPGDLVAVAGGDGTVGKVAMFLVGRRVPLTILPLGTANNISKTFGLADTALEALVDGWIDGSLRKVDVGIATGPWGSTCFIEGIGMGLFAGTMAKLQARDNLELVHLDQTQEKVASVVQMMHERLEDYPPTNLKVTLDGHDMSGEYILLEALNTRFVGPNLSLASNTDPSDGLFDVVVVAQDERHKLERHLSSYRKGPLYLPDLIVRQGRHLEIDWTGFDIHIDDEAWPGTTSTFPLEPSAIDVRIDPGAMAFLVPSGCL
jgi:diacylglycerol kinase family enzyme